MPPINENNPKTAKISFVLSSAFSGWRVGIKSLLVKADLTSGSAVGVSVGV